LSKKRLDTLWIPDYGEYPFDKQYDDGRVYREWVDPATGNTIREFEASGVIRDFTTHRVIRGAINKDNAVEMQMRAVEAKTNRAIEAARRGLQRGVSATELASDWGIAWEHIISAQAELAMTPDMGNASTRAAEFIMRAADLDPKNNKESLKLTDGKNKLELSNMSEDRLSSILSLLNQSKGTTGGQEEIIDI
jgi:hypothetical protein